MNKPQLFWKEYTFVINTLADIISQRYIGNVPYLDNELIDDVAETLQKAYKRVGNFGKYDADFLDNTFCPAFVKALELTETQHEKAFDLTFDLMRTIFLNEVEILAD